MTRRPVLLLTALLLTGCAQPPVPPPAPPPETPSPPPEPPAPLHEAPKAHASLGFSTDCTGQAKSEEIEAEALKIGMIPTAVPRPLANQLIDKTHVWHTESQGFDFYKSLSLHPGKPAQGCIRYAMSDTAGPYAEITLAVTYDPKMPEVLNIAPTRITYRDLSTRHAAIKVTLGLRTFSLERNSGRQSNSLQNQELLVDIFNSGPIDQRYDPAGGIATTIALPPWDYTESLSAPKHNLSFLAITVTEIADFDWLQSQILTLWPGYEYEATDVAKLKLGAAYYGRARRSAE